MVISAQKMLNGEGFDDKHMLQKAERELERVRECRDLVIIYDHLINFSVTIALCVDWIYHLKLSEKDQWKGKSEKSFSNWVRTQSDEMAVFIDVSNECKHANRNHRNYIAQKIHMSYIKDKSAIPTYVNKGFFLNKGNNGEMFFMPTVKYNDKQRSFFDTAMDALKWLKQLDIEQAKPVSSKELKQLKIS